MVIKNINAWEVIDYLNKLSDDEGNEWYYEYNIVPKSFKLTDWSNDGKVCNIEFDVQFNNWGTYMFCDDNRIKMSEGKISVSLGEPIEGGGFEGVVVDELNSWLPTHKFDKKSDVIFYQLINEAYSELGCLKFDDGKRYIDDIIYKLNRAKTLIK